MYIDIHSFEMCDHYVPCSFEVDDEIAGAISTLNKKGFHTAFCCAGHASEECFSSCAYIQFEFGGITPEILPEGWIWEEDGQMEYVYSSDTKEGLAEEIKRVMRELLIWAQQLPEVY